MAVLAKILPCQMQRVAIPTIQPVLARATVSVHMMKRKNKNEREKIMDAILRPNNIKT